MNLSIVIVNWNSKRFLRDCILSIVRHTRRIDYQILVVDSASFDGCGDMLRNEFPSVIFIQSDTNIGFARANNLASRGALGDYLLFLNPDTELTPMAIDVLLEHVVDRPQAGAVGCRLLNLDGSIQTSCIQKFPTLLNQSLSSDLLRHLFPMSRLWGIAALFDPKAVPSAVEVVSGACLLVRRTAFERVGGFSEHYPMYGEDLDLCHKLQEAGLTNYFIPHATVRHFGGGSTDCAPNDFSVVMMRESIWRFLRISRGPRYASAYRVSTLILAIVRLVLLAIAYPVNWVRHRIPRQRQAMRKWRAILGWSLNLRRARLPA